MGIVKIDIKYHKRKKMPSRIAMKKKVGTMSLIKKFVMHLWNPEMSYLNKQLCTLQRTSALWTVIAILDDIFFALTV
jgi:hypothetical protein